MYNVKQKTLEESLTKRLQDLEEIMSGPEDRVEEIDRSKKALNRKISRHKTSRKPEAL